ncbi:MAG: GDSL-type esterase/lipase family protein [Bacteroidales bacterium]
MIKIKTITSLGLFLLLAVSNSQGQDPARFKKEVDKVVQKSDSLHVNGNLILFTGSSSVRRWDYIGSWFPGKNILNTGFGGSHMSDLIFFADDVILRYKPSQVFIYEGDNDLFAGKEPELIAEQARQLIKKLRKELPSIKIVLIAAKPSPSRWSLKEKYIKLNSLYQSIDKQYRYVEYADVWTPMLNNNGKPERSLFISDSLHINPKGYDLWAIEMKKHMKK